MGLFDWVRRARVAVPTTDPRPDVHGSASPVTDGAAAPDRSPIFDDDWFEAVESELQARSEKDAEAEAAAVVRGKHYTEWVERIRSLKRSGDVDGALRLALECVDATEREARVQQMSPAPWYTETVAVIYRQRGQFDDEVAVIERYLAARVSAESANPGARNAKLVERLARARQLQAGQH